MNQILIEEYLDAEKELRRLMSVYDKETEEEVEQRNQLDAIWDRLAADEQEHVSRVSLYGVV